MIEIVEMKEYSSALAPWLSEMNENMLIEVKGFVNFLSNKLEKMNNEEEKCEREISDKISSLLKWESVANTLLPRMSLGKNYVDTLTLTNEPFRIIKCEDKTVFVLLNTQTVENFEESKQDMVKATGFIFTKCLRQVRTKTESRDIMTAVRCEVDISSLQIIRVFREDKYVIKRVGKRMQNERQNIILKREFKVQQMLSKLEHKGINQLVAYCEDSTSMFGISVSAGDKDLLDTLQDQLKFYGTTFTEQRVKKLFRTAVEGFVIAHNMGIAHRDISLENIVVQTDELKKEHLEIIDWGHSCSTNEQVVTHYGPIGKERYFSPELLEKSEVYNPFKSDVFSLGVCLFSALTGQMPFASITDDRAAVLKKGARYLLRAIKKEDSLSDAAIDLLDKCLKWSASERISMKAVYQHEFFD